MLFGTPDEDPSQMISLSSGELKDVFKFEALHNS